MVGDVMVSDWNLGLICDIEVVEECVVVWFIVVGEIYLVIVDMIEVVVEGVVVSILIVIVVWCILIVSVYENVVLND